MVPDSRYSSMHHTHLPGAATSTESPRETRRLDTLEVRNDNGQVLGRCSTVGERGEKNGRLPDMESLGGDSEMSTMCSTKGVGQAGLPMTLDS